MSDTIWFMTLRDDGEISGHNCMVDRPANMTPKLGVTPNRSKTWPWSLEAYVRAASWEAAQEAARQAFARHIESEAQP